MEKPWNINNTAALQDTSTFVYTEHKGEVIANKLARPLLEVKSASWIQPYFNLFDYDSIDYEMLRFQETDSCGFVLDDDDVTKVPFGKDPGDKASLLMLQKEDSEYILRVNKDRQKDPERANYLVVRSLVDKENKEKGYILSAGDIIRLGQIEYQISEMRCAGRQSKELETVTFHDMLYQEEKFTQNKIVDVTAEVERLNEMRSKADAEEVTCRYCLSESITSDPFEDILICPCECKGGSSYVHLHCLCAWIKQKILSQDNSGIKIYKWENLKCEICKAKWPIIVKFREQSKRLLSLEKPEGPYMIIEQISVNKENRKNNNIISLIEGKEGLDLTVGKHYSNKFQLTDPSISEQHASIHWVDGRFVLKDKKSKFGTLVRMSGDWKIGPDRVAVQSGKTVFSIMRKETSNLLSGADHRDK